jgi:peptide/nickel transport system substrate-binding protein/oligopeptide transport system substrate-binding protein
VNDTTIEILVSQKTGYFLQALTYPTSYVVEKSVVEKYTSSTWTDHLSDNNGQGGDGPFKVKSYSHSTGIVFEPNTNYTGKQPQLKEVDFTFYKTAQTAYAAYQTSQVDFVDALPSAQLNEIKQLPNNQYSQNSELTIDYIAMNYLYKPFDNIKIREAFALAVNRDILMSSIFQNGRIASCHIVPEGMPGYNSSLTCPGGSTTRGDTARAKTLFEEGLKEEGLTDATFPKVTITYASDSTALTNEITTLESEWNSALGITVSSTAVEFNTLLSEEAKTACTTPTNLSACNNTGLQMWTAAWGADYPDPQDWITLQFGKGQANNMWNYGQNESSAASAQQAEQTKMTAADAELDNTTRMSSYNAIEQSVVNDVGWLSLDQRLAHRVVKPYVIGITFNALSLTPPDNWTNVYIAQH